MQETWFTSDTHFGHANVIQHSKRPFVSTEEMDEALIALWNQYVDKRDNVYHLGDFAWKNVEQYRRRLNGNVHLILGNHDRLKAHQHVLFTWVKPVHMLKVGEGRIWLSHYCHQVWPKAHKGSWHLYGHSHGTLPESDSKKSMDVGVDAAANLLAEGSIDPGTVLPHYYRPLSLGEVTAVMNERIWEPVDYHVQREV